MRIQAMIDILIEDAWASLDGSVGEELSLL
jgi:hypothetical protein